MTHCSFLNTRMLISNDLLAAAPFFAMNNFVQLSAVMSDVRFEGTQFVWPGPKNELVSASVAHLSQYINCTMDNLVFRNNNMGISLAGVLYSGSAGTVTNSLFTNNQLSNTDNLFETDWNSYGGFGAIAMRNVTFVGNKGFKGGSPYDSLGSLRAGSFNLSSVTLEASRNLSVVVATQTSYFSDCDFHIPPGNPASVVKFIRGADTIYHRNIYNRNPRATRLAIEQGVFADCEMAATSPLACGAGETCTNLHHDGVVVGYSCQ